MFTIYLIDDLAPFDMFFSLPIVLMIVSIVFNSIIFSLHMFFVIFI